MTRFFCFTCIFVSLSLRSVISVINPNVRLKQHHVKVSPSAQSHPCVCVSFHFFPGKPGLLYRCNVLDDILTAGSNIQDTGKSIDVNMDF